MTEVVDMRNCPSCGKSINSDASRCMYCFAKSEAIRKVVVRPESPSHSGVGTTAVSAASGSAPLVVNRYRDAYRVGGALVGVGSAIKVIGFVLAALIGLASLGAAKGLLGGGAIFIGVFFASIVGLLVWVVGVMVAAQGQILQATLDTAVASSRFLTDAERADAMSLPRAIAERPTPRPQMA